MTILKTLIFLSITSLLIATIESCSHCVQGTGNTITQNRDVANFSSVNFGTQGTIYISQDTFTSVRIVAQQDVLDDMATDVHDGELSIYNHHCLGSNPPITIYVTTPDLNAVSMGGDGDLYVTSVVNTDHFDATLSGSGNLHVQQAVNAPAMTITLSGSGNIDEWAYCSTMKSTISGSGQITISGTATSHTSNTSGSGDIYGYGFITDTAQVSISGSGNEELFVNDLLDVTISGSGDVSYKGNAVVTSHISGSGNITHVN